MSKIQTALLTCLISSALVSTACVTVNVNFPESAVQKATDDYVRDLYRAKEKGKSPGQEASPAPVSKVSLWNAFENEAMADDFKLQSPKADEIKGRLASRLDEVTAQKRAGAIGEASDGLLMLKDPKLPPLLQKKVKNLMDEENSDRMQLYREVLKINGLDSGAISQIQKSFARSFQAPSPSGTWVQDSSGTWTRKP